jgi:26S proteasome regulatory subunit N3
MHAHRLATIREDEECLAQLSNLLLRNYIHFNHYDQAEKLISKITFPESATTNQMARFMYYNGNDSRNLSLRANQNNSFGLYGCS